MRFHGRKQGEVGEKMHGNSVTRPSSVDSCIKLFGGVMTKHQCLGNLKGKKFI